MFRELSEQEENISVRILVLVTKQKGKVHRGRSDFVLGDGAENDEKVYKGFLDKRGSETKDGNSSFLNSFKRIIGWF